MIDPDGIRAREAAATARLWSRISTLHEENARLLVGLERIAASNRAVTVFAVVFGNYFPAEIEGLYSTREVAEAVCDALGDSTWRVQEMAVRERVARGLEKPPEFA